MALVEMSVVEQRYRAVLAVGRGEPKIVVAAQLLSAVDLADDAVIGVGDDLGVERPRPLGADGAVSSW